MAANVGRVQGCPMVYFKTKNSNLGKFGRALEYSQHLEFIMGILVHFKGIGNLVSFGTF
jgi:hypothetical protein